MLAARLCLRPKRADGREPPLIMGAKPPGARLVLRSLGRVCMARARGKGLAPRLSKLGQVPLEAFGETDKEARHVAVIRNPEAECAAWPVERDKAPMLWFGFGSVGDKKGWGFARSQHVLENSAHGDGEPSGRRFTLPGRLNGSGHKG
jgi:hypothetical protein